MEINQEMSRIETDGESFYAEISITVIEKDLRLMMSVAYVGSVKVNTAVIKTATICF